jgi:hypothetical protein
LGNEDRLPFCCIYALQIEAGEKKTKVLSKFSVLVPPKIMGCCGRQYSYVEKSKRKCNYNKDHFINNKHTVVSRAGLGRQRRQRLEVELYQHETKRPLGRYWSGSKYRNGLLNDNFSQGFWA